MSALAFTPRPAPIGDRPAPWWCVRVYRAGVLWTATFVRGLDAGDACDRAAWYLGARTGDRYQAEPEPMVTR